MWCGEQGRPIIVWLLFNDDMDAVERGEGLVAIFRRGGERNADFWDGHWRKVLGGVYVRFGGEGWYKLKEVEE